MANGKLPVSLPAKGQFADFVDVPTLIHGEPYLNGVKYQKIGPFVELYVSVQFNSAPTYQEIFELPSGYRPLYDMPFTGIGGESYSSKSNIIIRVATGKVLVTSEDKYVTAHIVFLCGM